MAMTDCTLQASTAVRVSGTYPPPGVVSAVSPLRDIVVSQAATGGVTISYGTGSGQCDLIVCQDRNIAAGSSATYDIYAGTDLTDLDGLTAAFRHVKYVGVFVVTGGDASGVKVGAAAANTWVGFFGSATDTQTIFPSGPPYQGGSPAGVAVSSPGSLNFKIANLGASAATVRIVLAGTSV